MTVPCARSCLALALALTLTGASPQERAPLVFEGRTPCSPIANDFTGFPAANCEKIKWEVTLRFDAAGAPATWTYRGTRTTGEGRWRIVRGRPADARAVVYQLAYGDGRTLSLLSIDDQVLLLLKADLSLLVGDPGYSYALNRVPN